MEDIKQEGLTLREAMKYLYLGDRIWNTWAKEKPSGSDDVSDAWIGSVYPDGTPLKPTDSKACRHCGCDYLELENFHPR